MSLKIRENFKTSLNPKFTGSGKSGLFCSNGIVEAPVKIIRKIVITT